MKQDCTFCKILNGDLPGTINRITNNWATLIPLDRISEGHILVIPTSHSETILNLEDKEALKELGEVLKFVSNKQLKENHADGINILNANNKAAQQSAFHLHFHIVPRYENDGLDLWFREKL